MRHSYIYAEDTEGRIYRFDNEWFYDQFIMNRRYPYNGQIEVITRARFSGLKKICEYDNPYWDEIMRGVSVYRNRWY